MLEARQLPLKILSFVEFIAAAIELGLEKKNCCSSFAEKGISRTLRPSKDFASYWTFGPSLDFAVLVEPSFAIEAAWIAAVIKEFTFKPLASY